MKVKSVFCQAPKAHKSRFCKCPEAFNTINVWLFVGKLIVAVLHSKMLLVAQVNQAIVATPTVRMDNAFKLHTATDDTLESGFWAVRDYFRVNSTVAFEQAENNSFPSGPTASDASYPTSAEVTFINLNLDRKSVV